ncbi:DUF4440 domain-containing protein [Mammaliicoccus sp. FSL K6-3158]|uniref:nuclear transport factor 2 family protein n=1 Tax=Mammaliicoccus TaxID=2803850 RepID=UPI002DB6C0AF|nr:DUF4440 domain-containing protein [Mammaliicoccus sciuri]
MKQQFYELECAHLDASNRNDKSFIINLLDDEFKEIGKSGRMIYKRDIEEATLHTFDYEISDFIVEKIQKGIVLTTYELINKTDHITTKRSTLWIRKQSEWKMRFHQGTIVKK